MARPARSPLLGYNHNVKYRGRIYHVQTEDSGPANPHLFTHLYYEGTIVATKRHEYDRDSSDEVVRGLMQGQHKAILKELRHGSHDERLTLFFTSRGEPVSIGDAAGAGETMTDGTSAMDAFGGGALLDAVAEGILAPEMITAPPTTPAAAGLPEGARFSVDVSTTLTEVPALDLDALPPELIAPAPELMPPPRSLPTGGPGIYAMRGSGEYPTLDAGVRPPRPSEPLMPLVIFDPEPPVVARPPPPPPVTVPPRPSRPPPPPPATITGSASRPSRPLSSELTPPLGSSRPSRPLSSELTPPLGSTRPSRPFGTPPPVAVPRVRPSQVPPPPPVRPPVHAGVAAPVRPTLAPRTPPPAVEPVGVVVQRQVGIGTPNAARPAVPVPRRRPAQPIPYVVKEGTHPTVAQPHAPAPITTPLVVAPPPLPPSPRTTLSPPTLPREEMVGDKSLDEVILAYLSQGDGNNE
jgi:hypothetical protein